MSVICWPLMRNVTPLPVAPSDLRLDRYRHVADMVEQVSLPVSDLLVGLPSARLAVLWKGVGVRTIWLGLVMTVVAAMGLASLPTVPPAQANGTDIVVLGGSSAVSDSVLQELAKCTSGSVSRISGANRYATAAAVSSTFLSPGVDVAYVATGVNFPDALAGSAAAGAGVGGPVLLVKPTSVPSETAAELNRLNPKTIVVLGGTAAISAGVESALGAYGTVVRVAGPDRYSTGALVSSYAFPTGASTAYVATGTNFPDALAGGPAAVGAMGPVLLVKPDSIPSSVAAELTRLNLSSIKVLGGTAAISASVESSLKAYAPTVTRLSGSNRYATAAAVSKNTFSPGVGTIFIATGTNFPDALAGGPIAGILGGPILLTKPDSVPSDTRNEIERLTGVSCQPPPPPVTFGPGLHRIGIDIPAGTYRNSGFSSGCYWERLSGFGGTFDEIIANNFTYVRQIVELKPTDAGFDADGECGTWSNDLSPSKAPAASFGGGIWQVPSEIAPGLWRNAPIDTGCYWERLAGFSGEFDDIIANDFISDKTPVVVDVSASDTGFSVDLECGSWTYLGP